MKDELLKTVGHLIKEFKDKHDQVLVDVSSMGQKIIHACKKIAQSWSGSFAGYHGRLYYKGFNAPTLENRFSVEWGCIHGLPDGWTERTPGEVKEKIAQLTGNKLSADELEHTIKQLISAAEDLRTEIVINFSSFSFGEGQEKELFSQIEKFQFGERLHEFVSGHLPKQMATRDSEALMEGMCVPSHLYYEGLGTEAESTCKSIQEFLKLADRLLRQLEIKEKMSSSKSEPSITNNLKNLHPEIYSKCHELYAKAHYAEAAEKGFKVVRDRLRTLTGYETGSDAFGKGKLHIKGATAAHVDEDFNEGVKFLTMAIDRFRNEKAHTSDAKIEDPVRAYEYLRLSSLAMNLLDNTEILKQ